MTFANFFTAWKCKCYKWKQNTIRLTLKTVKGMYQVTWKFTKSELIFKNKKKRKLPKRTTLIYQFLFFNLSPSAFETIINRFTAVWTQPDFIYHWTSLYEKEKKHFGIIRQFTNRVRFILTTFVYIFIFMSLMWFAIRFSKRKRANISQTEWIKTRDIPMRQINRI